MKDLRLELRFKNARLYDEIQKRFDGLKVNNFNRNLGIMLKAAEIMGVGKHNLYDFVNLTKNPYTKHSTDTTYRPNKIALKIANHLGVPFEELFPVRLYTANFPRILTANVESVSMLSLGSAQVAKLLLDGGGVPALEKKLDTTKAHEALLEAMRGHLSKREKDILCLRFGLLGGEPLTLEEIGYHYSLCKDRIRQIESKALRKLRNPVVACGLSAFMDSLITPESPLS